MCFQPLTINFISFQLPTTFSQDPITSFLRPFHSLRAPLLNFIFLSCLIFRWQLSMMSYLYPRCCSRFCCLVFCQQTLNDYLQMKQAELIYEMIYLCLNNYWTDFKNYCDFIFDLIWWLIKLIRWSFLFILFKETYKLISCLINYD